MKFNLVTKSFVLASLITSCLYSPVFAEADSPSIAIIIDDIGYRQRDDLKAIALPGNIAYAVLPHSPNARTMSRLANERGKVVLIHLPMQAVEEDKNRFLGPGALTLEMTREQFMRTMDLNLHSIPEAVGVNNHMGSLLTRHPGHMQWLMEYLTTNKKFYLDSVTSDQSIASKIANERNVPYLKRDVFLDNVQNEHYIHKQFESLVRLARVNGHAIAIGHPHPETIQVLNRNLVELENYGVVLVSLLDLVKKRYSNKHRKRVSLKAYP